MINYPPALQETRVWSLGQEDTLEKVMATHSNIFVWKIPRREEPDRLTGGSQSMESQRVGYSWATKQARVSLFGIYRYYFLSSVYFGLLRVSVCLCVCLCVCVFLIPYS